MQVNSPGASKSLSFFKFRRIQRPNFESEKAGKYARNWTSTLLKYQILILFLQDCCYIALKEDNFVVLRVVHKTENSKVLVIFKNSDS